MAIGCAEDIAESLQECDNGKYVTFIYALFRNLQWPYQVCVFFDRSTIASSALITDHLMTY